MKKIKVLEIVPTLSMSNGVAAYIFNYYKNIDKNKFEFTFLVVRESDQISRIEELKELGAKIDVLPLEKNFIKYLKIVDTYFKNNQFDIIHCNVPTMAFIYLRAAKRNNQKIRIIHSHATKAGDTLVKSIRNKFLIKLGRLYANYNFACSNAAGKSMFGKDTYFLMNNAIDYEDYSFSKEIRNKYKKNMGLEGKIVIGTVGRLAIQKNHKYLIEIMKKVVKENPNYILIIAGTGPLENELKEQIKEYKLKSNVKLLGSRTDVQKLYNVMDIFVLPSLYEGLPVVGVEAQTNGLSCIMASTITKEIAITNNCEFVNISNDDIEIWKDKIIKCPSRDNFNKKNKVNQEYEIKYMVKKFENKCIEIVAEKK